MKQKKKYDILDDVKNFPAVKTSDNFLEDLHGKLDKMIADEKLSEASASALKSKKSKTLKEIFSGMISSRYLVPALGTLTLLFIFYYFISSDDKKTTVEDKSNVNNEHLQFPPAAYPPVSGNNYLKDTPMVNPDKEIKKLITKGKQITDDGGKLMSDLIKEKEKELRLLTPESITKNFGFVDLSQSMNDLKTLDLRSNAFNKDKLELLKAKIDSLVQR